MALWAAFVVETAAGRIYHIGDTGFHEGINYRAAAAKHGDFRLAILPIGAYEPRWFMAGQHQGPEDAVAGMVLAKAQYAAGHHWSTFQLTDEPIDEPGRLLAETLRKRDIARERFPPDAAGRGLGRAEGLTVSRGPDPRVRPRRAVAPVAAGEEAFGHAHDGQDHGPERQPDGDEPELTGARRDAEGGGEPDVGGRGEVVHAAARDEDRAGRDEADGLRQSLDHPQGVEPAFALCRKAGLELERRDGDEGGAEGDRAWVRTPAEMPRNSRSRPSASPESDASPSRQTISQSVMGRPRHPVASRMPTARRGRPFLGR